MNDLTYKVTEKVIETEENFIFTTIKPWCENVMQRKISKCDLERALVLYFNGGSILDKIRVEIEALPKTYPFVNHIDTYVKEDDVKKIIDKYKAERSEE